MERWDKKNQVKGHKQHLSKLTDAEVLAIYGSKDSRRILADRYGVTRQAITCIRQGRSWSWLTGAKKKCRKLQS